MKSTGAQLLKTVNCTYFWILNQWKVRYLRLKTKGEVLRIHSFELLSTDFWWFAWYTLTMLYEFLLSKVSFWCHEALKVQQKSVLSFTKILILEMTPCVFHLKYFGFYCIKIQKKGLSRKADFKTALDYLKMWSLTLSWPMKTRPKGLLDPK